MCELDAYFSRIALNEIPSANAEGLMTVQRAHRLAIPIENLDIFLGRGISLDSERVFEKLVTQRRGGYCFEQNQLFLWALREVGFEARPLLARVWLTADKVQPLTHTLNLVTLNGQNWIADAGFSGDFTPPMPLESNQPAEAPGGILYRLIEEERGWMLQRDGGTGWQDQYSFHLTPVELCDLEMSNHWTSTRPQTRFTTLRIVSRALPDGRAGIMDRQLSVTHNQQTETRDIGAATEYRALLAEMFDLHLSAQEVSGLHLFD